MTARPYAQGLARRALDDLPNFLSLVAFFAATALIFRSIEFAMIVTASLGFHELGHAALIAYFRLDWHITFGVAGAWTWSPMDARSRLSNMANCGIHLAGPAFSLLLALAAVLLDKFVFANEPYLLRLANFSATIGLLNLLPLGDLTDGGKVLRRAAGALHGRARIWAVVLPLAAMLGLVGLAHLPYARLPNLPLFGVLLLLAGLWMTLSLLLETYRRAGSGTAARPAAMPFIPVTSQRAQPGISGPGQAEALQTWAEHPESGARMTSRGAFLVVLMIWDLLALGLVIISKTSFWLAPDYVLGSLRNVLAVLSLLGVPLL